MAASLMRTLVSPAGTGLLNSLFSFAPPAKRRNDNENHIGLVASPKVINWHSDRNVENLPLIGAKDRHFGKKRTRLAKVGFSRRITCDEKLLTLSGQTPEGVFYPFLTVLN